METMNRKNRSAIVRELKVLGAEGSNGSAQANTFTLIDARNVFSCKSPCSSVVGYTVFRVIYT